MKLLFCYFSMVFVFFLFNSCSQTESIITSYPKPGINSDYLIEGEKIFLDFYGDEKDKQRSIQTLTNRCLDNSLNDSHSCYNLSVLLLQMNRKLESLSFIEKAVEKSPKDSLYQSMHRQLSLHLQKPESLKSDELTREFTKMEIACKLQKEELVVAHLESMLVQGIINANVLQSGFLLDCLGLENKQRLLKTAKKPDTNYADLYYKEKAKSDPYSGFWDSSYLVRKKKLEDEPEPKQKLTQIWKELRIAVKSGNGVSAKSHLKDFLSELHSPKSKIDKTKQLALERAAYILIEQDGFFKNQRDLLKEFSNTDPQ